MLIEIQQAEDLLINEIFLAWYYKSDSEKVAHFENWMNAHPEKSTVVAQACDILDSLRLTDIKVSPAQLKVAEEKLNTVINKKHFSIGSRSRMRWIAVAASVVVLFSAGLGLSNYFSRSTLKTPFGEISSQLLPDGSEVTLNANTKLTYYKWKDGQDREVWVNGEAYFHVKKTPLKTRFIVHTSRFDIIVTGTRFNVVNRSDRANVLLKEGSVIVKPNDIAENKKEIFMHPGDFVEYHDHQFKKLVRNDNKIIAWKDKKLVFENTSIREMATTIEEHYGVKVTIGDSSLPTKSISGMLPNDNLDVLLQSLEATGEYTIDRTDGGIVLRSRP